jgi:hypothetical protein
MCIEHRRTEYVSVGLTTYSEHNRGTWLEQEAWR